jgi:hypothetical protein
MQPGRELLNEEPPSGSGNHRLLEMAPQKNKNRARSTEETGLVTLLGGEIAERDGEMALAHARQPRNTMFSTR